MAEKGTISEIKRCLLCLKEDGKYICPRCGIYYCSVNCYRSKLHTNCSEGFYKECVEEEFKMVHNDPKESKQMMEILKKLHNVESEHSVELDSDDEDELDIEDSLTSRLNGIDLNDADKIWDCLTKEEKVGFEHLIQSGDVTGIIPNYKPWWENSYRKQIEDLDELLNKKNEKEYTSLCPRLLNIPSISDKKKTSPYISCNIKNVIASYAFTVRYYMGEHHNSSEEATNMLSLLSTNLHAAQNFESDELAVKSVIHQIINNNDIISSAETTSTMLADVKRIYEGPECSNANFYILSALSDVHDLFQKALKHKRDKNVGEFSKKFADVTISKMDRKAIRLYIKKIDYYLAWVK